MSRGAVREVTMTFGFIKARLLERIVADLFTPLAVWLVILWFLAAIILLLGSEAG